MCSQAWCYYLAYYQGTHTVNCLLSMGVLSVFEVCFQAFCLVLFPFLFSIFELGNLTFQMFKIWRDWSFLFPCWWDYVVVNRVTAKCVVSVKCKLNTWRGNKWPIVTVRGRNCLELVDDSLLLGGVRVLNPFGYKLWISTSKAVVNHIDTSCHWYEFGPLNLLILRTWL